MQSYDAVGPILPGVASELGLPRDVVVLCGGNDATLAAWSGGLSSPGDANIISGTCDIASVCTDRPVASREFNVRAHVLPGRWLTFFVATPASPSLVPPDLLPGSTPGVLRRVPAGPSSRSWRPVVMSADRTPTYVPYLGAALLAGRKAPSMRHAPTTREILSPS
jgi:hypothetical protein